MSQYPVNADATSVDDVPFPQAIDEVSLPTHTLPAHTVPPSFTPPLNTASSEFSPHERVKFSGNSSEYFGIWISNLVLTIITIGFYAPWAKVRRLRYFYGHTSLANRTFDFTGVPTKILQGRLIAAAVYFIFAFGGRYSPTVAIVGFVLLFLVLPWLLRATFRFNARNSKYNNSRLFFSSSNAKIYKVLLICLLITVFSLGLMTPYAIWLFKRYQFEHLHLGQLDFKLDVSVGRFFNAIYVPYLVAIGGGIAVTTLCFLSIFGFSYLGMSMGSSVIIIVAAVAFYVMMLVIVPLIQARLYKTTWNGVSLSNNRFQCDINQWRYSWIVISNWLAKILSIGLLSAWAAIRMYRYKVESLSVHLIDNPDDLLTLARQEPSAFAEELTDILDIDISL